MGNVFQVDVTPEPSAQEFHPFSHAEILDELNRITGSAVFRAAECHKSFLRYIVEQKLAGHGDDIKEYSVATGALGKKGSFDPRLDPIVRIQATKLRNRLARYYAAEGAGDVLQIELPRGRYAPVFMLALAATSSAEAPVNESAPEKDLCTKPEEKIEPTRAHIPTYERRASRFQSRLVVFGIAAILICAAVAAGGTYMSRRTAGASRVAQASVVIMPFRNLSSSKDDDYFSDGLTEELISSIARLKSVRVIGKTSAFELGDKDIDVIGIGRKLDVATVLQGTVRRSNGRVRVTAQLSETSHGTLLWSQIYEQEITDSVSIQSAIANAITAELGVHLTGEKNGASQPAFAENQGTANHQAYEAYLKGRYFCGKRKTPTTVPMAIAYYEEALKLDSAYAPAWAGIANCYATARSMMGKSYSETTPRIQEAAHQAIRLDPNIGEAYIDLGVVSTLTWDWATAEENFLKGISLSPNDANAHHSYSTFLMATGRVREAIQQAELALSLDPISPPVSTGLGRALRFNGQLDAAIAQLKKTLVIDPNYGPTREELAMAYLEKHMYAEAIAETRKAVASMDNIALPSSFARLGFAYAAAGQPREARAILDKLLPLADRGKSVAGSVAAIYFGLGDIDSTFHWFEKEADSHVGLSDLKSDPIYDPLRSDPRFARVLARMNLSDSPTPSGFITPTKY